MLHPKAQPDHLHRCGVFQRTPGMCDDGHRDVCLLDEQWHQHVCTDYHSHCPDNHSYYVTRELLVYKDGLLVMFCSRTLQPLVQVGVL